MLEEGTVAVVHYVGRLSADDGRVFDTSDIDVALAEGIYHPNRDYAPIEFRIGDGTVRSQIEAAVREMDVGETRTVHLGPEDAFGLRSDGRIVELPHDVFDEQPAEGDLVGPDLAPVDPDETRAVETGWVTAVGEHTVEIDFNHELAGESVVFDLRLLGVRENER